MTRSIAAFFLISTAVYCQNDPAAVELFRDRGLGLFIHWSVDGSLGGVISHSLVGAPPTMSIALFAHMTVFVY